MAAQAAWFGSDGGDGGDNGFRQRERDQFQVRPLPNEDVFYFRTVIDNSRVVRDADPAIWTACWRFITMAAVAVVVIVGLLLPNAYGMLAGARLHRLERESKQLLAERQMLENEQSQLLSPERLEQFAATEQFQPPAPGSVHYLPPSDHSLALAGGQR
ncbi:MAG: hypothetical protein FJW20_05530 [Acidimicrobiia bacterium]|nr:hypothetical protein [Acidimicrobiia bacterium]